MDIIIFLGFLLFIYLCGSAKEIHDEQVNYLITQQMFEELRKKKSTKPSIQQNTEDNPEDIPIEWFMWSDL